MAKNLYSGRIDAEPLCTGGRSPAPTVSSAVASPTATVSTRTINIKDDPFAE